MFEKYTSISEIFVTWLQFDDILALIVL
jgi:hypothetical protein